MSVDIPVSSDITDENSRCAGDKRDDNQYVNNKNPHSLANIITGIAGSILLSLSGQSLLASGSL